MILATFYGADDGGSGDQGARLREIPRGRAGRWDAWESAGAKGPSSRVSTSILRTGTAQHQAPEKVPEMEKEVRFEAYLCEDAEIAFGLWNNRQDRQIGHKQSS